MWVHVLIQRAFPGKPQVQHKVIKMAEIVVPSTTSTLKKLEEQLTCAICLDIYTNPKTFSYLHSFCQQCLEGLPLDPQGDNYFISSPLVVMIPSYLNQQE